MNLAPDHVTITVDGAAIVLRPTLRCAYRLNRDPGFQALAAGVIDGDLLLIARMIAEASGTTIKPESLLAESLLDEHYLATLSGNLLAFLGQMIGVDASDDDKAAPKDKPVDPKAKTITRQEHYERLFAIGTGWLNWTPAETWAASPSEIMAAYEGRLDLLKAVFGGGTDKEEEARQSIPFSQRARAVMIALGGKVIKREKQKARA